MDKEYESFIDILPEAEKEKVLGHMLYETFYAGQATVEHVQRIRELAYCHLMFPEGMAEYCDGLHYFLTGVESSASASFSHWPHAVTAVMLLIEGRLTEARYESGHKITPVCSAEIL